MLHSGFPTPHGQTRIGSECRTESLRKEVAMAPLAQDFWCHALTGFPTPRASFGKDTERKPTLHAPDCNLLLKIRWAVGKPRSMCNGARILERPYHRASPPGSDYADAGFEVQCQVGIYVALLQTTYPGGVRPPPLYYNCCARWSSAMISSESGVRRIQTSLCFSGQADLKQRLARASQAEQYLVEI